MPDILNALTTEVKSSGALITAIHSIACASSIEEIADIVKHAARMATGADGVTFVLREGDQCYYLDEEAIAPLWKGRRFPMSACVSGWVMHHRIPAVIPDINLDSRVPQDAYRATFVRTMAMIPIRSSAPLGAIGAYWATTGDVWPEAVHWQQALADATSGAIEAVFARSEMERAQRNRAGSRGGGDEIVSMCAWTRRILHNGEWVSVESYLHSRFGLRVVHSISENATDALAAELADEFKSDRNWITG